MVNIFHKCSEHTANTDLCTNGSALLDKRDTRALEEVIFTYRFQDLFHDTLYIKKQTSCCGGLKFSIKACSLIIAYQCYTKLSKQQM